LVARYYEPKLDPEDEEREKQESASTWTSKCKHLTALTQKLKKYPINL
jgi:hypothetical protein